MAYGLSKDLNGRTIVDEVLRGREIIIAKNTKYDVYQRGLASVVSKSFDKEIFGGKVTNENISNKGLAAWLHKPIIRKFNKIKVNSSFIDNIWCGDLEDMKWINKLIEDLDFYYLLLIFMAYMNFIPLIDGKLIKVNL